MQLICKHIYVLTGQMAYRMTYNQSSHIRVRFGIYHFVRRVPAKRLTKSHLIGMLIGNVNVIPFNGPTGYTDEL